MAGATPLRLAGSKTRGYTTAMSDTPLVIRDNREKHRFEADLGDGSFAIAEYKLLPHRIVFTHTEVPPQHEGQGIGSALIRFGLASARERGLKVVPVCPFFAAYIRSHAEEQDLLDPSWREKLGLT
jgi:predicted GNAT family acetyltransferase